MRILRAVFRAITRLQLGLALGLLGVALAMVPLGLQAVGYELGVKEGYVLLVSAALLGVAALVVLIWPWITGAWSWFRRDAELHEAQEAQDRLRERLREVEQQNEELRQENEELVAERNAPPESQDGEADGPPRSVPYPPTFDVSQATNPGLHDITVIGKDDQVVYGAGSSGLKANRFTVMGTEAAKSMYENDAKKAAEEAVERHKGRDAETPPPESDEGDG